MCINLEKMLVVLGKILKELTTHYNSRVANNIMNIYQILLNDKDLIDIIAESIDDELFASLQSPKTDPIFNQFCQKLLSII